MDGSLRRGVDSAPLQVDSFHFLVNLLAPLCPQVCEQKRAAKTPPQVEWMLPITFLYLAGLLNSSPEHAWQFLAETVHAEFRVLPRACVRC